MDGSSRRRAAVGLVGLASLLTGAGIAHASPPEIYPLAKVHRGQTGYGVTTMAGTTPERFTFEVVSVVKNFLPKQDIILIKSDDPKMQVTGFWQGMSGSPLYLDDKLLCAFSYGFRFNKVAIGGCTPLEYMKHEGLDTPRRGSIQARGPQGATVVVPAAATLEDWRRLTPNVDVAQAFAALGPAHKSWLLSAPLPAAIARPDPVADAGGQVLQASVPLSVAGFRRPRSARSSSCSATPISHRCAPGGTSSAHSANKPAVSS